MVNSALVRAWSLWVLLISSQVTSMSLVPGICSVQFVKANKIKTTAKITPDLRIIYIFTI